MNIASLQMLRPFSHFNLASYGMIALLLVFYSQNVRKLLVYYLPCTYISTTHWVCCLDLGPSPLREPWKPLNFKHGSKNLKISRRCPKGHQKTTKMRSKTLPQDTKFMHHWRKCNLSKPLFWLCLEYIQTRYSDIIFSLSASNTWTMKLSSTLASQITCEIRITNMCPKWT